ncbi:MAG TPA: type VI secretion system Vgr family protein, partial [Burkholderiaceae bacterium]|nr:type VI secretion system Vgr family protein [Burkholderiaceae bacterium]
MSAAFFSLDSFAELARLSDDRRLYECHVGQGDVALFVESFTGHEALSALWRFDFVCAAPDAHVDLDALIGQRFTWHTALADGSRASRSGLIAQACALGADGGLAHYHLRVVPWLWLLEQRRRDQIFQDASVLDIADAVFAEYAPLARWQWADDVAEHLRDARPRSYCRQARETDYAFIARLFAEEGLGFYFDEDEAAPLGHALRIFARSNAVPEDTAAANPLGGRGWRLHRADASEAQDSLQRFGAVRTLQAASTTRTSWDYKTKRTLSAQAASAEPIGSANAPVLESYDWCGQYAFADTRDGDRLVRLQREALEARRERWIGAGNVRTARCGRWFELTQSTLEGLGTNSADRQFVLTDIAHAGFNNGLAAADDAERRLRLAHRASDTTFDDDDVIARAHRTGYANAIGAVRRAVPWRPVLDDDTGLRSQPRALMAGPVTARVVGPEGELHATDGREVHCDRLGRIRVQFPWQSARRDCWVRVAQRQAGAGFGWRALPRIGQEVLVAFEGGDPDRPVVLGALYNGRGEHAPDALATAADHRPAAQGNLAAGHAPAWHGAGGESHRHAGALLGLRTQEFGGAGHNELVFDDSPQQLRARLASTQEHSELNLGHLIHPADNYRGSLRGLGAELRTDAHGAWRAERGAMLSSYAIAPTEPAGDFTAGVALLKQAVALCGALCEKAATHQSVTLASVLGVDRQNTSVIDEAAAPLKAMQRAANATVPAHAFEEAQAALAERGASATSDAPRVPHFGAAMPGVAARAGLGVFASGSM